MPCMTPGSPQHGKNFHGNQQQSGFGLLSCLNEMDNLGDGASMEDLRYSNDIPCV